MKVRLDWIRNTYGETETRIYRDTASLDPQNLPAPIATVGPGVTTWTDDTVVDNTTYYYLAAALYQGMEYVSAELEVLADPNAIVTGKTTFDAIDLDQPVADVVADVEAFPSAEVVAAFEYGKLFELSDQAAELTAWGQHKWPQEHSGIQRMWVLARDNDTGNVLRVYAIRDTAADPDTAINTATTWDFEALWQGNVSAGTGTWELSDATVAFSSPSLSSDDGSWAFKHGANTQGNQSRPPGDVWGVAAWNANDTDAVMMAGADVGNNFQGIVILAPV